jgi:hypothetical protein
LAILHSLICMPFNSLIIFSNSQQKNKRKALKVVQIHSKEYLLKMAQC